MGIWSALCAVAALALVAAAKLIGANGTTIRRGARIRATATAIGLDLVTDPAAGHAMVAMVLLELRVAPAIRTGMLLRRLFAVTVRTVRWLHKITGLFSRSSQCEPLRGR